MSTLEEVILIFHEVVAEKVDTFYRETPNQTTYPKEITPNLEEHYIKLAESALRRVEKGKIRAKSSIKDSGQQNIETAIASFDSSLVNSQKRKESYQNYEEAIGDLLTEPEFERLTSGIREAYQKLMPAGTVNQEPYDNIKKALTAAFNAVKDSIYSQGEKDGGSKKGFKPLSTRYDIKYHLFKDDGKGLKSTGKGGMVNQGLTDKKQNTYLGRRTKEGSVFSDLHPIIGADTSVSRDHLFFNETKRGFEVNDVSGNGIAGSDYKKGHYTIKRPTGDNRDPILQLLVGIEYQGQNFSIPVNFGGDNQDRYQLKLTFTPKKLE